MNETKKNSILVVDDNSANIASLTHILHNDYTIYAAKTGAMAIEAAGTYLPDIILLDIMMPDMDGYEVMGILKAAEKTRHIPVIFITGLNNPDDEEKGLTMGCADYITKPFRSAIVKRRVKNQIDILNQLRTIERISMTDQLTNLPNRRYFETILNDEWRRALREHEPLSVLVLDVDKFKNYNDNYGHRQGDAALQTVGEHLSNMFGRANDLVARWGGEEFIVLLPNTDAAAAMAVAEKIRLSIEATDICRHDDKRGISHISVSIGVNTWTAEYDSMGAGELVSGADAALFSAKNKGRNQVRHFMKEGAEAPDDGRKIIFIVDDNATSLITAETALEKRYRLLSMTSAREMFGLLKKWVPDLILMDVAMPDMDGFEALARLKKSNLHAHIPVIFLTALSGAVNEAYGIELGAVDFITKPFSETVLNKRIKNHLQLDELIRERTAQLERRTNELVESTEELIMLRNGIVCTMADLVERRDKDTGGHLDRTSVYMGILLDAMLMQGLYAELLEDLDLESLVSSARLHDVGKIVIPDSILNKPGRLSAEEFTIMKEHSTEGERIIDRAIERTGKTGFLKCAKLFAGYHHERWDGTGYPYGLSGTDIPLHGRLMALIDVYDALVSDRPYKKAFPHEEAVHIILEESGRHFDPDIVRVFNKINHQFKAVNVA